MTDNFKARLKELRALSRTDPLRVDILEEEQAMTDDIEPADHERAGWDWLENMVGSISDDDPNDIAYSSDQMVDAFMAGAAIAVPLPDPDIEGLVYVPGVWRCAKCNFTLIQSNLNVQDGSVTARDNPGDKCPNCESPLWRVSYKDWATENEKAWEEHLSRKEDEIASLASQRDAARAEALEEAANYLDGYAGGHHMAQSCATALRSLIDQPPASGEDHDPQDFLGAHLARAVNAELDRIQNRWNGRTDNALDRDKAFTAIMALFRMFGCRDTHTAAQIAWVDLLEALGLNKPLSPKCAKSCALLEGSSGEDETVRLLWELRSHLEYIDSRFSTGTTPAMIARIDAHLKEKGHG